MIWGEPYGFPLFLGKSGFFICLTPCPLSLAEGEGVPPRHPAVHLAANGATPPLEGRGVFPKAYCKIGAGFGTFGAVLAVF